MTTVTIHQAKTNLSRLIADALRGEEVIIARGSTPTVRLVPVVSVVKRQPGLLKGKIKLDSGFFDPLPEDELAAWNCED